MEETDRYIKKRKMIAFGNKVLFLIFGILPIQRNKIAVCTFEGKGGFGCNPKYIVEKLHRKSPKYRFIWFVNENGKEFPDYIEKVKNNVWNRAIHLSTSKIWIDNYRKPYGTRKRKGQFYIQTWHGTIGFKATGLWRGEAFSKMAYLVSKNDSDMIDYVVTDSEWCHEMFPDGLVYYGEFLKYGAPRCDVLYGDREQKKQRFKERFCLGKEARFIMFAPTFREREQGGRRRVYSEEWSLDFNRLMDTLEKKWEGKWYLCLRIHPQLVSSGSGYTDREFGGRVIDISSDDDMYESLAAMDALVTDYSSVAMDAGFAEIPVFIYADDIKEYAEDRGALLWNLSGDSRAVVKNNRKMTPHIDTELPFQIAQNNDELEQNIMEFDESLYSDRMTQFKRDVQLVFDGKASSRVADKIEELIRKDVKKMR